MNAQYLKHDIDGVVEIIHHGSYADFKMDCHTDLQDTYMKIKLQWNLSKATTLGPPIHGLSREVVSGKSDLYPATSTYFGQIIEVTKN